MVFTLLTNAGVIETHTSILIVDDNAAALETLGRLLTAWGISNVRHASSAEEALEIVQSRPFDLILCDYRLEGMNGVDFLEWLRGAGNQTPVIMMSGAPDKAGVIRAMEQTEVDFLAKPFPIAELAAAMDRFTVGDDSSSAHPTGPWEFLETQECCRPSS